MDRHSLQLLEFDRITASIAAGAVLEATRAAVDRLVVPTTDRVAIAQRRDAIAEMVALMRDDKDVPVVPLEDPREFLHRAHIEDSHLSGPELAQVTLLLANGSAIKRFFKAHHDTAPGVSHLAGQLLALPEVQRGLARAIAEDGSVADGASPELRRLRRDISRTYGRIERRLLTLMHDGDLQDTFSGDRPTLRSGRLVLPMKSNRWTAVDGLVHDRSHTGQTFFVEPAATIEMGNELQNMAAQEETEVRRILLELTGRLRPHLDDLAASFEVLVQIDLLRAAARLAYRRDMAPAEMAEAGGPLELVEARHPVLQSALETEGRAAALVPLTIRIDPSLRVLAVTGSNTGGKTVAIKTLGLLALMAQAGLPVPARRASLPVFDRVLVDIGDEQSIEQSLSTFSGHMSQLVGVLRRATDRSLVLLDELGAGTDPAEGGALACAVLQTLAERRATAVVTTHLREVKIYCHEQPGMQNAAMEFNAETLQPTFRLVQGEPGQSHALAIAERLGLPQNVIGRAKEFLSDEHLNLESLLGRMSEERRQLREELDTARRERQTAAEQRARLEAELAESKTERKALLREAYREASGIVDNTKREMQQVIREARDKADATADVETLRQEVHRKRKRLAQGARQTHERARAKLRPEDIREGQTVYVETLRSNGTVEAVNRRRSRVTVNVCGLSVDVRAADLSEPEAEETRGRTPRRTRVARATSETPMELNLIGQRAHEAVANLERFLNEACLADIGRVQVIHGRGTGALMRAVHEMLRGHPLVESFRSGDGSEGGIAVTVVTLKE